MVAHGEYSISIVFSLHRGQPKNFSAVILAECLQAQAYPALPALVLKPSNAKQAMLLCLR